MFKRIIRKDDGAPWGTTGLNTAGWKHIPTELIDISLLVATQDGVYFHALTKDVAPMFGDEYPHVVYFEGDYYLEDGHHRVVRAALDGQTHVLARVMYMS